MWNDFQNISLKKVMAQNSICDMLPFARKKKDYIFLIEHNRIFWGKKPKTTGLDIVSGEESWVDRGIFSPFLYAL